MQLKECLDLEVSHAPNYYSSVSSSANNLNGMGVELQSEIEASDYHIQQEQALHELEDVGVPSTSHLGPVPR